MEGISSNNNIEQIQQEKFKKEVIAFLEKVFNLEKNKEERFNRLSLLANSFINAGILDKEKFTNELEQYNNIEDKDEFVNKMLIALSPILKVNKKDPKLLEKIRADSFIEQGKFIKLNDILSYGIHKNEAHIHLAPSKELLRENGKENYLNLVLDGLIKLASIVEKNEKILKITATSPVVTNNPKRMTDFHFTIKGLIGKEEKGRWAEDKEVSFAEMSRETLLSNYLNKSQS